MVRERKYIKESGGGRGIASLVFAFAFAVAIALPVSLDSGFSVNGAFAAGNGNGNAGGNGKGKALGKAGAPGQQQDQVADADEHAGVSGGATAGVGAEAGGDEIAEATPLVLEDTNNKVVQELAGLPDSSVLSEEEEQEAIRSGWGTWRTADGPNGVTAQ